MKRLQSTHTNSCKQYRCQQLFLSFFFLFLSFRSLFKRIIWNDSSTVLISIVVWYIVPIHIFLISILHNQSSPIQIAHRHNFGSHVCLLLMLSRAPCRHVILLLLLSRLSISTETRLILLAKLNRQENQRSGSRLELNEYYYKHCYYTILSDVIAVEFHALLGFSLMSAEQRIHSTEQLSEILSPSLSVNSVG